jgi:hypothetical protein
MTQDSKAAAGWSRVCYGVDSSATDQGMVRAERRGRHLNYKVVPFNRDVLADAVARGASVASGIPVGLGIAAWVVAPLASEAKARRVFATLLDIQLPFPLESCTYHFTEAVRAQQVTLPASAVSRGATLGSAGEGAPVGVASLALVALISNVESHLGELRHDGIDPHVLDYEGVALWTQSLKEHPVRNQDSIRVVVYMRGSDGVVVLGCSETFWSAHRISTTEPLAIDRFLRAQMGSDNAPSASGRSIEWVWAGRGLGEGDGGAAFRADVEQRWPGRSTLIDEPERFLARALATRALTPGPLRTNLRQGLLSHAGAQAHVLSGRIRSAVAIVVSGVLLCGAAAWSDFSVASRQSALDQMFSKRVDAIVGYHVPAKGETAILIAERSLAERIQKQKPLVDAFYPSLGVSLQSVLGVLQIQGVQIAHLQVESGRLQVKGTVPNTITDQVLCDALEPLDFRVEVKRGAGSGTDRFSFVLNTIPEESHE